MAETALPVSPLPGLRTIELTAGHEPLLQRFLEANPGYYRIIQGEPPGPREAHEEIHGELPAGWTFTKKWLVGYVDATGELAAMANVVSDILAKGVWHIGFFVLATARHGTGEAQVLYRGLEDWARQNGANWLRLGIVKGNARAERFWRAQGYLQTRIREGMQYGKQVNTILVMYKPLSGGTLEQYLALIERDRPE